MNRRDFLLSTAATVGALAAAPALALAPAEPVVAGAHWHRYTYPLWDRFGSGQMYTCSVYVRSENKMTAQAAHERMMEVYPQMRDLEVVEVAPGSRVYHAVAASGDPVPAAPNLLVSHDMWAPTLTEGVHLVTDH